jgi:formate C-acetyltransferase
MFLNDEVILAGLDRLAVPREDAVNYSMSGCNELILTGQSQMGSAEGHINLLRALEKTLGQCFVHAGETSSAKTFDDFYDAYGRMLKKDIDIILEISESRDLLAMRQSMLLPSLLTDGCIESGLPITKGGAKYNFCTWCAAGLINLADSLSVIRQFVFEEKSIGLSDFAAMLHADWEGYEDVRADILKRGHFFGNDDDAADSLVNRVIDTLCAFVEEKVPVRGGKYTFGTLAGYELAHIAFGRNTGATPDGRHAGDEFAATIAAGPGKDRNGVTAFLKSASKIEYVKIPSAVTVGVHLERSMTDSDHKIDLLTSLLQTYFKMGGVHLQINYISADELAKAQENPQAYRNLRVRVTGFSGFFTQFDKDLQDEIISRTAHRR